jgi:hypothetical protein
MTRTELHTRALAMLDAAEAAWRPQIEHNLHYGIYLDPWDAGMLAALAMARRHLVDSFGAWQMSGQFGSDKQVTDDEMRMAEICNRAYAEQHDAALADVAALCGWEVA